ncbi:MAG: tripartite tricarboxylate transporter permease [Candidatus Pacearchaeota archaeon]
MQLNSMIIELIIALIVGIAIGTLTGLFPGIHINLVSTFVLTFSSTLLIFISPIYLVVFVISLAITHTFIDFIPTIFLGAPNEDTALSILPGHKLLLKGLGYTAILLTIYGGLISIPILLILIPLFLNFLPIIYPNAVRIMPIILILISGFLIYSEGKNKRFLALIIFLLSGFLGLATLNLPIKEPLLPLFSGLFGASGLILSIRNKTIIPDQKILNLKQIKLPKISYLKSFFTITIASPIIAFIPGTGSNQAAIISSKVIGKLDEKEFLFVIGGINTLMMCLSFITLYSINKTRTGAAVAVSKLIPKLSSENLSIIIIILIISSIIAATLTLKLAKFFSKKINKINYKKISIIILIILAILSIKFSGLIGLLVFITSTALGIFCIQTKIKRTELMGCLLIPTILIYLV